MKATGTQNNFFTITDPASGAGFHANWAFSQTALRQMVADGRVIFPPTTTGTGEPIGAVATPPAPGGGGVV